ncbi:MAG: helicase C-terminal domain-containing protein [Hallerella porci]|uniref:helicase C-terminal domain-containing protein n=1 Tax=Hallerella TaxID=2815788 RepID=UPI000D05F3DA|nr:MULTISPECIES: helicase C-terminal domain-containing protein [Hallerella]MCI5601028.1 DEAD/DEAH box helicase [Hallerella sp.]MDY3920743.1 helicase C-terminal domain-containing protein [Hallerella porci]
MKPNVYVAFDLETTGLDFEHDEIIEVALERFENGEPKESKDFLIKPKQNLRPFIASLTGISDADLADAPDFATVAGQIRQFIGDYPLVAHNAQFDSKFLRSTFAKVGISIEENPVLDTLALSRIAYRSVPNHKLETLVSYLNIKRERAHRALPDADACGKLFWMALAEIEKLDAFAKHHLARLACGTVWEKIFEDCTPSHEELLTQEPESVTPPKISSAKERLPRVREFFGQGGKLSAVIPNFSARDSQLDFAEVVERNMYKGGISLLEAGTGMGKTLAYLIPAALKAAAGERVVVSTATRTLEEQLSKHDFPMIASLFGGKVSPLVLKGRGNYICLRKFEEHLKSPDVLLAPDERETFMTLIPWVEQTKTGEGSENTGFNLSRNRLLWNKFASDASTCLGEKCRFYEKCFGLNARRQAAKANLLFINHSLFLSDLALDFALLPTYEHIVFDEAHRLPAMSHASFGKMVRFFRLRNITKILVHPKAQEKGLVAEMEAQLTKANAESSLLDACAKLREATMECEKSLHRFFLKLGKKVFKNKADGFRYTKGILAEYDTDPKTVIESCNAVKAIAEDICSQLRNNSAFALMARNLEGAAMEISRFNEDFAFITAAGKEDWVFYMEEPGNPHTAILRAIPLYPGNNWTEKFYPWIKSATFTSATLSLQNSFDYFEERMGMLSPKLSKFKHPFVRNYPSAFDVNAKRRIIIADFLPKPNDPNFQAAVENVLSEILPGNKKNALVLFTSILSMTKSHQALAPLFAKMNKLLLCQQIDGGMDSLVEMFRKKREACLLGCQVFWEGIDLPESALELLVIPKLPFPNPSNPLIAGLADKLKEKNENAFKSLYIPEALLELRQGLGRLIRSESDSGTALFLDNRLVREPYGKSFTRLWGFKHEVAHSVEELRKLLGL